MNVYMVLTGFLCFTSILDILFKGNKGIMAKIHKLTAFFPVVFVPMILYFLYILNKFTTKVCFCQFRDPYF